MRIRPLEFEFIDLVIKLLKSHPDFSEVVHTPARLYQGIYLRPDIVCKRGGSDVVIEVKGAPMVASRIDGAVSQLKRYRKAWPGATLVFAIPIALQEFHKRSFSQQDIEIWDLPRLWEIFKFQIQSMEAGTGERWLRNIAKTTEFEGQEQIFCERLAAIEKGRKGWVEFQRTCAAVFEFLFAPPLNSPLSEYSDYPGSNRRDIIFPNYSTSGFWHFLRQTYMAHYIVIDAKNYKGRVGNPLSFKWPTTSKRRGRAYSALFVVDQNSTRPLFMYRESSG